MPTLARILLACALAAAPATTIGCAETPVLDEARVVDLTHAFDDGVVAWPSTQRFEYRRSIFGRDDQGRWYATGDMRMGEHTGTHVDSPLHLAEGLHSTADLPLRQLIGPIRVVDVSGPCKHDSDYSATVADLARHEQLHGRVPVGAAVLFRIGWDTKWSNPRSYLGTNDDDRLDDLHFPGLSAALTHELVLRRVDLVGIDGPAIDPGVVRDQPAERALAEANIPALVNLDGLAGLPAIGATMIALPIKLTGGASGPVRVVAIVP
jgi:kynurenine formamidase